MAAIRQLGSKALQLPLFCKHSGAIVHIRNTSKDAAKPILYSYWTSSCSWRVRIALALKDIKYDIRATSLLKKDSVHVYNPDFLKVNPMQTVPALYIDGNTLCDSVAIMHYLDETRPQNAFFPKDPVQRAKVREIVELICSAIQPLQNRLVLETIGEEKNMDWARHWISRGFRGLEKVLAQSSGKFCVGDEISMADVCLVPQVFNALRYKTDMSPYPTIVRLNEDLLKLDSFKVSHPHVQPDCPPKLAKKA
ncbi:hypothetical protein KR074_008111 [Drosophila pseudoananassae]|nr:hypothetical protein KR074_008111 [Drosophila pseudoananassae]